MADQAIDHGGRGELDTDAGARGGLYALLARAFRPPDDELHAALDAGDFADEVDSLLELTALDVDPTAFDAIDDDADTLNARYHDLFVIGYAEYEDRTDGSISTSEPPVPLYESAYRTDVSWNDVNLDLARVYDYYDIEVDTETRDHHDYLPLILEFAGYLARREAAVDDSAARSRLDLLDRHLRVLVEGIAERMAAEPGTETYGELIDLLDAVTAADRADLADRLEVA